MDGITLRLRHLDAVYGRNFKLPAFSKGTELCFGISSIKDCKQSYLYVSAPCESNTSDESNVHSLQNPVWDQLNISCPWHILASKSCFLTFFVSVDDVKTILFEMELHFSGLIPFDSEMREKVPVKSLENQVFFRLLGNIYAPQSYFANITESYFSSINVSSRSILKNSYDFGSLQQLIINSQVVEYQLNQIAELSENMLLLKKFLCQILEKSILSEDLASCEHFLLRQIYTMRSTLEHKQKKLDLVNEERASVEARVAEITQARLAIDQQIINSDSLVINARAQLQHAQTLLSRRTHRLILELAELFSTEFGRINPKMPDENCYQEYDEYDRPHYANSGRTSSSISIASQAVDNQDDFDKDSVDADSHQLATGQEKCMTSPDLFLSATNLFTNSDNHPNGNFVSSGLELLLLRVVAVILNQPLRYSVDLTEGCCRGKIIDQLVPDLTDADRVFPFYYLSRNSLLPPHKFALSLVNQNILALYSFANKSTQTRAPTSPITMLNLKRLIEAILTTWFTPCHSRTPSNTIMIGRKHCYA